MIATLFTYLLVACALGLSEAGALGRSEVMKIMDAAYNSDPELSAHGTEGGLYGETGLDAIADSMAALNPRSGDHFVDLGSGNGKLNVAASLLFGLSKSSGYENSNTRHEQACRVLDFLKGNSTVPGPLAATSFHGSINFVKGDFTQEVWSDADIIFGGLLPDEELMSKLSDKFRMMKNGARILMLKEINPNFLKDIENKGSSSHKLGWTSNHPIYRYDRKDGELSAIEKKEKTDKETKEKDEKEKAEKDKVEKDEKEKAEKEKASSSSTASIFDSYSPSTSSYSSPSSLTSSISTPTLSNPTPSLLSSSSSISDNYQKILDSIKTPTTAAAVTTAAATTTPYKSSLLAASSLGSSAPTASSRALDDAWEKLKAMTGVGAPSTPSSSSSFASTTSSLDAISAKAAASLSSSPSSPSVGSIFENTYADIMKQLKDKPATPSYSGSVLGDIGGYNSRTSVLGITVPSSALALNAQENTIVPKESSLTSDGDKMFADSLAGLAKLGTMTDNLRKLGDEAIPKAEMLLQLAESNEEEGEHEEESKKVQFQMQLKQLTTPSGATVFVYEKVGEQEKVSNQDEEEKEEKEEKVPNSIHMLSGIEMRHGSRCSAQF